MIKALLKTAAALCAAAAAAVLTAASTSAYEFEIQKTADGKSYEISDVWSFSEDEGKTVTFPTSQDGHKITGIADNMRIYFAADKVVIPEGYTYIGANTFSYSEIKELSLPASLKTVGEGAVSHNENLTAVNFAMGSNLTTVGADAFQSDPVLKSINLGSKLTTIGSGAFWGCESLSSVELGASLRSIGESCFAYSGLKTAVIPSNVQKVGAGAFYGCPALESIYVGSGITAIPDSFCEECGELTNVNLSAVRTIGSSAFAWCPKLKKVNMPSTVTSISESAFYSNDTELTAAKGSYVERFCQEYEYYGFTFNPKSLKKLSSCTASYSIPDTTFTGSPVAADIVLKDGGSTLTAGTDYSVFLTHNVEVGKAVMTVMGEGDYTGCLTRTFDIKPLNLSDPNVKVTIPCASYMYRGRGIKPTVTVKYKGTKISASAYSVAFANNTYPGTADITVSGKGGFTTGTYKRHFTVTKLDLADSSVKVTIPSASYMYRGRAIKPTVKVKVGSAVIPASDYTLTLSNNTYPGTARIKVTAKGKYATGSRSRTFTVTKLDLSKCTASIPYASYTYSGSAIKPEVKLKLGSAVIPKNDYSVSYINNINVGTAGITVSAKSARTTGKLSRSFTVKPGKIGKVSISTTGSKSTISWTKAAQADGYEVWTAWGYKNVPEGKSYYAVKMSYTAETLFKTVAGSDKKSLTFTLNAQNRDCEYAVRAYKKVNGKTYYGNYSFCDAPYSLVAMINGAPKSSSRSSYNIVNTQGKTDVYTKRTLSSSSIAAIKDFAKKNYKSDTTDGEKVKIMLDYIRSTFRYNYGFATNYPNYNYNSPANNALVVKAGQCNDYNGAVTELLNYLGYDAKLIVGYSYRLTTQHLWTEITIGGTDYVIEGGITSRLVQDPATGKEVRTTVVNFANDFTTYPDMPVYYKHGKIVS